MTRQRPKPEKSRRGKGEGVLGTFKRAAGG